MVGRVWGGGREEAHGSLEFLPISFRSMAARSFPRRANWIEASDAPPPPPSPAALSCCFSLEISRSFDCVSVLYLASSFEEPAASGSLSARVKWPLTVPRAPSSFALEPKILEPRRSLSVAHGGSARYAREPWG